ncbi:MAG: flagellar motor switch protein FliN [Planctomycetota bacterium]
MSEIDQAEVSTSTDAEQEEEQAAEAVTAQKVSFGPLGGPVEEGDRQNLDLLLDVPIPVTVEVGRAELTLDEILDLAPGSIVSLDKRAEEPVDLRVNGKLVARGEVVMVDDCYGLRVTQIIDTSGRIESLRAAQ